MNKRSRPKANPGSLHKLDDGNLLQLPEYLNPSEFRPPSKQKIHDAAYGREQFHIKDERERQEAARLRRLADVRAAVYSNRPSIPPRPQGSASSTPNLHNDFATKTHMGRLDVAYEKLDAYVERSVEQLIAAMKEQRQALEDRMDHRLEGFDERITLVTNAANETRSAFDAAIGDLARNRHSGGEHDREGAADNKMWAELSVFQARLEKLETQTSQSAEDSAQAHVHAKQSETRLKSVEESIERLEVAANAAEEQTRTAIDAAIADMARESQEKAATADIQAKVSDTRTEGLQALLADLSARMEAEQLRTKMLDARVEGLQTAVGQVSSRFEETRAASHLQSVVSELSSRYETEHARTLSRVDALQEQFVGSQSVVAELNTRLEAEQARTLSRLDALQEQLVGSMATGGRMSVLEERMTAIANSANEAHASAGELRSSLDKAFHELSGKLETRTALAETASADTIAKVVDDRIASIDGLRTAMHDIATRVEEEQARARKRIDEVQDHTVSKSYIDERLNVIEWIKAEQLRGSKRLDEVFEQFVSKVYIDEYLHSSESRLQHLENVRQQESATLLAVPGRSDYDDVCRRLEMVEKGSTDVQELRWRQEAFTSNLDMLARRLQEAIDQSMSADTRMQESAAREAAAREAASREAAAKEATAKEAAAREAAAIEVAAKEAAAKEAASKQTEAVAGMMRDRIHGLDDKIIDIQNRLDVCAPLAVVKQLTARVDEEVSKQTEVVADLKRECVGGLENKIMDIQQRLDVCAPLAVVSQLESRMDGGFDALVVQVEATRWMIQKTEEVGDQIMQAFVLNVDERLHKCENIISKHSEYMKKTSGLHFHHQHGSLSTKHHRHHHGKHMTRNSTKEEIVEAEKAIVGFWFDVWARGPKHNDTDPSSPSRGSSDNVTRGA